MLGDILEIFGVYYRLRRFIKTERPSGRRRGSRSSCGRQHSFIKENRIANSGRHLIEVCACVEYRQQWEYAAAELTAPTASLMLTCCMANIWQPLLLTLITRHHGKLVIRTLRL